MKSHNELTVDISQNLNLEELKKYIRDNPDCSKLSVSKSTKSDNFGKEYRLGSIKTVIGLLSESQITDLEISFSKQKYLNIILNALESN